MKKYGFWLWGIFFVCMMAVAGCGHGSRKNAMMDKCDTVAEEQYTADYGFAENKAKTEEASAASVVEKVEKTQNTKDVNMEKKLIRTARLGIETEYFDASVKELEQLCSELEGYIGNSSLDNQGQHRTYSLEMKIPQEHLDEFLNHVSEIGSMKIRYKHENTEDVTLEYFDAKEHKESLEVERERILKLIEQADSLEYVVSLEDKLSELRYRINSYESQLRHMDHQVTYSTVNIDIEEVQQITIEKNDTVGARIASGLKKTLTEIKEAFLNLLVWFVTKLPKLVIYGVVLFTVVKIGRKIYRKRKNKQENPVKSENNQ